ncbi:MAG: nuclear transport factor 2 family protein [Actinomycetota bacterium]|nr:nuclear transport factor 2 family protein [Actinomycetota bacterium]
MSEPEVLAAVDAIIDDFGHHRRDAYFAGFAEDATFVFHTGRGRLESRADYEAEWDRWEREEGFRVLACHSSARRLQQIGDDVAIFTHDVETELADGEGSITLQERETIVLQRRDGRWLCVHEHLSGRDA